MDIFSVPWLILALGAFFTGLGKGGLPGAGNLTVALFALVLQTLPGGVALLLGFLLPILISADIAAVLIYCRHTEWKFIFRLLPFFLIGILAGWLVFDYFKSRDELLKTRSVPFYWVYSTTFASMDKKHLQGRQIGS